MVVSCDIVCVGCVCDVVVLTLLCSYVDESEVFDREWRHKSGAVLPLKYYLYR